MATEATQEELQAGRGYEALFVPALFAPWTGHVVRKAAVKEGSHVLDIACGSGVLHAQRWSILANLAASLGLIQHLG